MLYLTEVCLRLFLLRSEFFLDRVNTFDAVLVILSSLEVLVLKPLAITTFRGFALARILRTFRLVRTFNHTGGFVEFHFILRTLTKSLGGIFWSMLLVGVVVGTAGIFMAEGLGEFIEDDTNPISDRTWAWERFGTSAKAIYTMFESTFTGTWTANSRKLVEDISAAFVIFWVPYVVLMNFAVMRVIAALFLKQVMALASADQEMAARQKEDAKTNVVRIMRTIFEEADLDGSGTINAAEFKRMIYKKHVHECFQELGVELFEVIALFHSLADDDGSADYDEFLNGALRLKDTVHFLDLSVVLNAVHNNYRHMKVIMDYLEQLGRGHTRAAEFARPLAGS
jgi:voltage-gated sodium channel